MTANGTDQLLTINGSINGSVPFTGRILMAELINYRQEVSSDEKLHKEIANDAGNLYKSLGRIHVFPLECWQFPFKVFWSVGRIFYSLVFTKL